MSLNSIEVLPRSINPSLSETAQAIDRLTSDQLNTVLCMVDQLDKLNREIQAMMPAFSAIAYEKLAANTSPSPDQFNSQDSVFAGLDNYWRIRDAAQRLEREVSRQRYVLVPIVKMLASEEVDA